MNDPYEKAFQTLGDPARGGNERVAAARALGATGDKQLVPRLQKFLERQRPPERDYIDHDPRVVERVVDIAVVGALHELGDDTQWDYLVRAVSRAGGGAGQAIRETQLAGQLIHRQGLKPLVERFVQLGGDKSEQTVINAVKTLAAADLPRPASHQPVPDDRSFQDEFKIAPRTLAKYFHDVQQASHGHVKLSREVEARLKSSDYTISEGQTEEIALKEVLCDEVALYGFAYFIEDKHATICTFPEAAQRWQAWWKSHGEKLTFVKDAGRFEIKE